MLRYLERNGRDKSDDERRRSDAWARGQDDNRAHNEKLSERVASDVFKKEDGEWITLKGVTKGNNVCYRMVWCEGYTDEIPITTNYVDTGLSNFALDVIGNQGPISFDTKMAEHGCQFEPPPRMLDEDILTLGRGGQVITATMVRNFLKKIKTHVESAMLERAGTTYLFNGIRKRGTRYTIMWG